MAATQTEQVVLKGLPLEALERWAVSVGEPAYRGQQLFDWMYHLGAQSAEAMDNLPKPLRQRLTEETIISTAEIVSSTPSQGGTTIKYLMALGDGRQVEAVSMLEKGRHTVCVSSQVGCNVGCGFCATASMGLLRNLKAGEIVDQLLLARDDRQEPVTNVVFMGMGEPLLNYREVLQAAELFHDPKGLGIGAGKITISTAGVVPRIEQFARENRPYRLAVSLNAATDEIRSRIMPINDTWPIAQLLSASRLYANRPKRTVTFEYVLLAGVNDSIADAKALVKLVQDIHCKVNLIPYNDIGGDFRRPAEEVIDAFFREVAGASFPVMIRWSNGSDIAAGCGQLAVEVA
ncbi:MAG: 23S rRNA (adenine(2503)-C(2))-methyltransferase RlmN [Candidatus Marinimicrobia bacterium]|nr:23S rRNA (adenine(2503)-C(2))-methyltransferase RlmN [Candidatus Neomarinimicrobiota bacterium]